MSLRYEQYHALKITREFLSWLMRDRSKWNKRDVRDRAYRCLRHYPFLRENGEPMFSNDNFRMEETDES